jgi:hypothetical protein
MSNVTIFYDSTKAQSILAMNVARLKYDNADNTLTIKDTAGLNESSILFTIDTITNGTQHEICVCALTAATHAEGKLTYDQVAYLDAKLVTANKGTVIRTNTCQANVTTTEIILDSGASAVNDFYNFTRFTQEYYIKTDGITTVYRYIKDYVGATKTCTVNDTSMAITTTETFTVYSHDHVYLIGDASSNEEASRYAWRTLFDSNNIPLILKVMGGYGSGFANCPKTVDTASSVAAGTLTHTGQFTDGAYNGGGYYVALLSGGGTYTTGQAEEISSNTTGVLTLKKNWTVTPSGTPTYAIYLGGTVLYDKYLNLAIPTYLWDDTANNFAIFKAMFDRYGDIASQGNDAAQTYQDKATMDDYAAKGKVIYDAQSAGVVS